jgi:hypothetical protein
VYEYPNVAEADSDATISSALTDTVTDALKEFVAENALVFDELHYSVTSLVEQTSTSRGV